MIRRVTRAVIDAVMPRSCLACRTPIPKCRAAEDLRAWLCANCIRELPRLTPPFCSKCGESFDGAITTTFRCANCADRKLRFDFSISAYRADGPARELIHRFKYSRTLALRQVIGRMLMHALDDPRIAADPRDGWLLVPVPLHRSRENARGFNQSREAALMLAELTGMTVVDCLARIRATETQASMGRNERLQNIRGAFAMSASEKVRARIKGARILVVDDVLTTGATTDECARILLRDGGAKKVVVITVARG